MNRIITIPLFILISSMSCLAFSAETISETPTGNSSHILKQKNESLEQMHQKHDQGLAFRRRLLGAPLGILGTVAFTSLVYECTQSDRRLKMDWVIVFGGMYGLIGVVGANLFFFSTSTQRLISEYQAMPATNEKELSLKVEFGEEILRDSADQSRRMRMIISNSAFVLSGLGAIALFSGGKDGRNKSMIFTLAFGAIGTGVRLARYEEEKLYDEYKNAFSSPQSSWNMKFQIFPIPQGGMANMQITF